MRSNIRHSNNTRTGESSSTSSGRTIPMMKLQEPKCAFKAKFLLPLWPSLEPLRKESHSINDMIQRLYV